MTEWVTGKVIQVIHWTKNLFSLIIQAPINPFVAGQFTKIGLEINGKKIQRAYSYVNAPSNQNLEFYLVTSPEGELSPMLHKLNSGDSIIISKEASGFFTLDTIPSCENLWMLATGTALGPYLSILTQGEGLERFKKIVLVHATRFAQDLSYFPLMVKLKLRYQDKLYIQTVVSRERVKNSLMGHIPSLIIDGSLEKAVGLKLQAKNSHVMLCGNPQMVHDTQKILKDKYGMDKHFRNKTGHITSEHYW